MKGGGNFNHNHIIHKNHSFSDSNGGKHWAAAAHGKPSSSLFPARLLILLLVFLSFIYFLYILSLFVSSSSSSCPPKTITISHSLSVLNSSSSSSSEISSSPSLNTTATALDDPNSRVGGDNATELRHIVFGIAASASLWDKRRDYIKIWWRPREMRGYVWLDKPVREMKSKSLNSQLPILKISGDTAKFPYSHRQGHRSAIRISRIVSETFRLGLPDARWFVMGDDDTVFVPDNLVRVLSKLDHRQPYYIGSLSESHLQNIYFSYGMAYGGGGFAISRPLAEALSKMQDGCLHRYPALYGSDDRIQACMAELGVPLTKHAGFHQYDVYGDLLGLLASHPVAPLVSLHHLDVVQPIFPGMSRANAIKKLFDGPVILDSAGVIQQSICYEGDKRWTVSVSWGFVVQLVRGVMSPREMEMPARTFLNWYKRADYTAYAFNTRPVARNPCQRPYFYYLSSARHDAETGTTETVYSRYREKHPTCKWNMEDPSAYVDRIVVQKKPDPGLWDRSPRRNCCRVRPVKTQKGKTMEINVGVCRAGEISQSS